MRYYGGNTMIESAKDATVGLLRKTEKYTKTDMVYLTSGGFWLFLKTGISAALALLVSVAFANLIIPETYGAYKYVFSIFGLLALFTLGGLGTSVMKSVAQGYDGTPGAILNIKIRWGLLGSIGSVAVAVYYFLNGNSELGSAFAVVAFFLPFVDTFGIWSTILTGKQLFKASVLYETITQAISALAVIIALLLSDTLWVILLSYFASMTIVRYIVYRHVIRLYTKNDAVDPSALKYGKHLSVLDVLSTAVEALDGILMWQFVGAAPLAVYSFAKSIPLQMSQALRRIPTLAFPKFATRDLRSMKKGMLSKVVLLTLLLGAITIAYILAAPTLFSLLFPQYMEAVPYTQLYALTLLLFPKKLIGTALSAKGYIKQQYVNSILTLTSKVILLFVLVPRYGIPGAIVAELVTQTVSYVTIATQFAFTKPRAQRE
jgi:O-antigen/teichoic acid export membrane protein